MDGAGARDRSGSARRGFMHHAQAYRRVLIVATGAGIGPVLPYLLEASPVRFECL
jgi:hypothetical protein